MVNYQHKRTILTNFSFKNTPNRWRGVFAWGVFLIGRFPLLGCFLNSLLTSPIIKLMLILLYTRPFCKLFKITYHKSHY